MDNKTGEPICPYCGEAFKTGDQLVPVFFVEQASSLIARPGQEPGKMMLRQLVAHNYCAVSAAVPLDGRRPELVVDVEKGEISVRMISVADQLKELKS